MPNVELDITPLQNAIMRLQEALVRCQENDGDDQLRDGLILRFEFTYEISHKMLKRFLAATSPNPTALNAMAFQGLIRTANEHNLLQGDWTDWKLYRDMRAKTSHAYAEQIAIDVVQEIPKFLEEATYLCNQLLAALR